MSYFHVLKEKLHRFNIKGGSILKQCVQRVCAVCV